jgi:hypothetical protein
METRKLLNARVCRLGWEKGHANHQPKREKKKSFNAEGSKRNIWVRAKRLVGQELTDWKVGQVRWAKIAEPSPNAPYCAALCPCGLILFGEEYNYVNEKKSIVRTRRSHTEGAKRSKTVRSSMQKECDLPSTRL